MKVEKISKVCSIQKSNSNHEMELFEKEENKKRKNKQNKNILDLNVGFKTNKETGFYFDESI